jgi:Flp pilus assembly protein TadD
VRQNASGSKSFQLAARQFPNEAFAHEGLGDGYVSAGQADKARSSYEQALKLSPKADTKRKLEQLRLSK